MSEIDAGLLAEVIGAVHQAQMEQCFSLTIPQLSSAITTIYQASIEQGKLVKKDEIIRLLSEAK